MHSTRFQTFLFTGKSSIIDQVLKNVRSILQDTVDYTYSNSNTSRPAASWMYSCALDTDRLGTSIFEYLSRE